MILSFWGLSNQIKVPTWSSLALPWAAREIFKYVGPCWLEMWFHFLQRKFCHVTLNRFPITKAELHLCLGKFIPASKLKNFTEWANSYVSARSTARMHVTFSRPSCMRKASRRKRSWQLVQQGAVPVELGRFVDFILQSSEGGREEPYTHKTRVSSTQGLGTLCNIPGFLESICQPFQ